MRFVPIQMPLKIPYRLIASYVYSEQVGVKRQDDGNTFEMVDWYNLIKLKAIFFILFTS